MFSIVVGTVMLTAANGKLERNHRTRQYALSFITCSDTCTRFDESGRKDVDSRGCPAGRIGPRNLGNPSISTEFPTSCTAVSDLTSARFIVPRCLCVNTYGQRDTSGNYTYSVAFQSRRVNNKGALLFFQLVSQLTRRSASTLRGKLGIYG